MSSRPASLRGLACLRDVSRVLLLLALVFGVSTACGNDGDSDATPSVVEQGTLPATTPATSPSPSPTPIATIATGAYGLYIYEPGAMSLEEREHPQGQHGLALGVDWFPDGERLAVSGPDIHVLSPARESSELIAFDSDAEPYAVSGFFDVLVSPDGSRIAYGCKVPVDYVISCWVPAQGGTSQEFGGTLQRWLSSTEILLLGTNAGSSYEAQVINVETNERRGARLLEFKPPAVSPDGSHGFRYRRGGTPVIDDHVSPTEAVAPLEGDLSELLIFDVAIRWSDDSSAAVVVESDRHQRDPFRVWLIDFRTGTVQLVTEIAQIADGPYLNLFADISRDGRIAILYGPSGHP